jgi:predicted Zn-dependent protease
MRSHELRWTRDPSLGDTRALLLDHTDGMIVGDRPETGVFVGELFMHPGLNFEIRFPDGWRTQNASSAVGATAPRGEAIIYLTGDMKPGDLVELADEFSVKAADEFGVKITEKKKVRLGHLSAVRYGFEGGGFGRSIVARVTFFPFAEATWRIVGAAPSGAANRYLGQILRSTRSFQPLTAESRAKIRTKHLHVILARGGEDLIQLGQRTNNAWTPTETALANGLLGNNTFEGGELIKTLRSERLE